MAIPEIIRPIVAYKFRGRRTSCSFGLQIRTVLRSSLPRVKLAKFEKILFFFCFLFIYIFFLSLFLPSVRAYEKISDAGNFFFPFFFLNVPFRTNYLDWRD